MANYSGSWVWEKIGEGPVGSQIVYQSEAAHSPRIKSPRNQASCLVVSPPGLGMLPGLNVDRSSFPSFPVRPLNSPTSLYSCFSLGLSWDRAVVTGHDAPRKSPRCKQLAVGALTVNRNAGRCRERHCPDRLSALLK